MSHVTSTSQKDLRDLHVGHACTIKKLWLRKTWEWNIDLLGEVKGKCPNVKEITVSRNRKTEEVPIMQSALNASTSTFSLTYNSVQTCNCQGTRQSPCMNSILHNSVQTWDCQGTWHSLCMNSILPAIAPPGGQDWDRISGQVCHSQRW